MRCNLHFGISFSSCAHICLTRVELRAPSLHKRAFELFAGEECVSALAVPLAALEKAFDHVIGIVGAATYIYSFPVWHDSKKYITEK